MINNLGVKRSLSARGIYLPIGEGRKMRKGPKKGIDSIEVARFKKRLQSMRWITYLDVPTWVAKHEMHKGIMLGR